MSSKKLSHNLTLSANKLRLDSLNKILKLDSGQKSKRKNEALSKQLSTVALTDFIANTSNCTLPDFSKFLSDPENVKEFREFLKTQHCQENIDFYLACEKYRNLRVDTIGKDFMTFMATQIYNDFLSENAKQQVNLDYECLERIKKQRLSKERPTPELFQDAQMEIFNLMRSDCYPRFCKTWRVDRKTARRILIEKLQNSSSLSSTSRNISLTNQDTKSILNSSNQGYYKHDLATSLISASSSSSTMRRTRSMKRKRDQTEGCPEDCPYFRVGLPCGHHNLGEANPTEQCGKSDLIDSVDLGRMHQVPKCCVRRSPPLPTLLRNPPPLPPKPEEDHKELSPILQKKYCAYVGKVYHV